MLEALVQPKDRWAPPSSKKTQPYNVTHLPTVIAYNQSSHQHALAPPADRCSILPLAAEDPHQSLRIEPSYLPRAAAR